MLFSSRVKDYRVERSTPPYKIMCALIGHLLITKHQTCQKYVKEMSKKCLKKLSGVHGTARSTVISLILLRNMSDHSVTLKTYANFT